MNKRKIIGLSIIAVIIGSLVTLGATADDTLRLPTLFSDDQKEISAPSSEQNSASPALVADDTSISNPQKTKPVISPQNTVTIPNINGVNIQNPPSTPEKPIGTLIVEPGTICVYVTRAYITGAVDPKHALIYYLWDWDDTVANQWVGPYGSGVTAGATHTWTTEGIYHVRVKAKDASGAESDWSDQLQVTIRILRGDMNKDGCINLADIDPFVLALCDPEKYRKQYGLDPMRGDCNNDNRLDFFDIDPFRALLFGCNDCASIHDMNQVLEKLSTLG